MKFKREEDEGDEDVEWEESIVTGESLHAKSICLSLTSYLAQNKKCKSEE